MIWANSDSLRRMGHDIPLAGETLDLAGREPIAAGDLQRVYAYPGRADLLVKVVRPGFADAKWTGWRGWLKRRRRLGVLTGALRTITEHLALRNAGVEPGRHIQEFVGLVETSEGPGVVVRAVRGADGGYAPTLRALIETGRYTPSVEALLNEFAAWLVASPLIVGDLHPGNVVLASDALHGERLVMIDGMGEKNLIPLNSWFPGLNRANSRARLKRLRRMLARRLAATGSPAL